MSLSLSIENEKQLPDGGPISFSIPPGGGAEIGRASYLDWVLPDAGKVVSNKHCEIRWRDDGFYLTDTSTNGTFVNGSEDRLHGSVKLKDGDRIAIGHYIILVGVAGEVAPAPRPAGLPRAVGLDELWGDAEAAPPISPDLLRPPPKRNGNSDFLNHVADLPWNGPAPAAPVPLARDAVDDEDWLPRGSSREPEPEAPADPPAPSVSPPAEARHEVWVPVSAPPAPPPPPAEEPPPRPPAREPAAAPDLPPPAAPQDEVTPPSAAARLAREVVPPADRWGDPAPTRPAPSAPSRPAEAEVLARFARGAGIPASTVAGRDPGEFAEEMGRLVRTIAAELKRLLDDRQQAKRTLKVSNHTTIAAFDNNPLKYQPSVEHALALMLGPPSRTYMGAQACIEASLKDVAEHQLLTFSAMQKAVQLLEKELDPAAIEKELEHEKGLAAMVGFRHSRLWDTYVHRWADRTKYHGDGLIGAFLKDFAKCYDELDNSSA